MELLRDFEETILRLIENQETLNLISEKESFSFEKEALLKTQESLKAHFSFLTDIYLTTRHLHRGSYIHKQLLIEKFSYLKQISHLNLTIPFESKLSLRKNRLRKSLSH